MNLIDSHAHIQEELYPGEIARVLAGAKEAGLVAIVNIGTSLRESKEIVALAQKYPKFLFPTVGLHPFDAQAEVEDLGQDAVEKRFQLLAQLPQVVGIGECGLDYGKDPTLTPETEKDRQAALFTMQLACAVERNLPVVVHCRNAWEDLFAILAPYPKLSTVILHSFTGDEAVAATAIDRGYYLSFSGIVTFKNAEGIRNAALITPASQLLIETDSPFLTPEPKRGMRNEPKNIILTAQYLSSLRTVDIAKLASNVEDNAKKVFNLPI